MGTTTPDLPRRRHPPRRRQRRLRLLMAAVPPAATVLLAAALVAWLAPGHPAGPPPGAVSDQGPIADEHYAWRPVAIGGGGFITGLAFDRSGRTRVARTDVHGAYLWDDVQGRWFPLVTAASMPDSDHIQAAMNSGAYEVAVAPGDADRLYLAIKDRVYRSDNRGQSWRVPGDFRFPHVFNANAPTRFAGPFIAVNPDNPDRLLIGTQHAGLWQSEDGAISWHRVAEVPVSRASGGDTAIGIPVWFAADAVYAAPAEAGIFVSRARGAFRPLVPPAEPQPRSVVRAASLPDGDMLASDRDSGGMWLYRGGVWRNLSDQELPRANWQGVAVSPQGLAYVTDEGGKLWCSADKGAHWARQQRSVAVGAGDPPWLHVADQSYFASGQLAFDPVTPGRLWVAAGTGPYVADLGDDTRCASVDWRSQVRGIEELVANDVVQPPGRAPLFAAWDFGIHRKPDLDAWSTTYGPRERVLIAAQQIDWSAADPSFLVTNASDTRTFCCSEDGNAVLAGYSTDGGINWHKFPTLPTPPGTSPYDPWRMAFGTIAVSADNVDNIVWQPANYRAPFYTRDRGQSWTRIAFPGERQALTGSYGAMLGGRKTLAADRVRPGTFYLVHSGDGGNAALAGLWRTTDGGAHWGRIYRGQIAPASNYAAKLRAVPGYAGHLFFTSGVAEAADTGLRRSVDGGRSWRIVPMVDHVDDIAFGKAAGTHYPALYLSGRVRGVYGIWRSIDNALSWQRLADFPLGRLDQVSVIEADKDVFGRVYIGYTGSGWIYGQPDHCFPAPLRQFDTAQCTAVRR